MKKTIALFSTLTVMLLVFNGCSNATAEISQRYNEIANAYNEVAVAVSNNAWNSDENVMNALTAAATSLENVKAIIEAGDMNKDIIAQINTELDNVNAIITEYKPIVAEPYVATNKMTQLNMLNSELTGLYNQAVQLAEVNGWNIDQGTADELDSIHSFIQTVNSAINGEVQVEDVQSETLSGTIQELINNVNTELIPRVSVTYTAQ